MKNETQEVEIKTEAQTTVTTKRKAIFNLLKILFIIVLVIIFVKIIGNFNSIATDKQTISYVEFSKEPETISINEVLTKNTQNILKEELIVEEKDIEYTTTYKNNNTLPKGVIQVLQEGRDGKEQIVIKKVYENDNLISEEEISKKIVKSSINKIVQVGTSNTSSNYKIKVGDTLYITPYNLIVRANPDIQEEKKYTISQNTQVKLKQIQDTWYYISWENKEGWVPSNCLTYINPNENVEKYNSTQTAVAKSKLLSNLSIDMQLNKPSGLTQEQFKKIFEGEEKDSNKIFYNNAEYFYYIEQQYNVNGVFVAAVGVHESNWGKSSISKDKRNLFGYGAADSDPYNKAYNFSSYSEGIDLIARVFAKYYLNPKGTLIYDGQTATGVFYNGPTLAGVNIRYASDKNWHQKVYSWMQYLYNRL